LLSEREQTPVAWKVFAHAGAGTTCFPTGNPRLQETESETLEMVKQIFRENRGNSLWLCHKNPVVLQKKEPEAVRTRILGTFHRM
jgi:hypothetical protein